MYNDSDFSRQRSSGNGVDSYGGQILCKEHDHLFCVYYMYAPKNKRVWCSRLYCATKTKVIGVINILNLDV